MTFAVGTVPSCTVGLQASRVALYLTWSTRGYSRGAVLSGPSVGPAAVVWNVRHTTYHQDLPERVTIVRPRHPFEGKSLAVVGAMHRKGRLTLTLILPDGTKSLIPAAWTDLAPTEPPRGVIGAKQIATRDSLEALIHASALVDALLGRLAETQ